MSLEVLHPGFLTLVQDFGRYGLQRNSITQGGPMDEHAYLWANKLLGNHFNDAQLEINFGGFAARFNKPTVIAVCGADLTATLNGEKIALWQSITVQAGDEIRFHHAASGLRAYLAVKKGFDITKQLTSCSTVVRERLGGSQQNGSKIAAKEILGYDSFSRELNIKDLGLKVPKPFIPEYTQRIQLRFIPNYSVTGCSEEAIEEFTQGVYSVTSQFDRMGYRLEGKAIKQSVNGIISQGISCGAIQLPKNGQPIVLMKDRQTMGGYPQLGCVASLDIPLLAQSIPNTKISFIPTQIEALEEELIAYKQFFALRH